MLSSRWSTVAIVVVLCILEARLLVGARSRPVAVAFVAAPDASLDAAPEGIEAEFAAHMTWDDVARGVWGLGAETGAVALDAAQREAILPLLREAQASRAALGEKRAVRAAVRLSLVADHVRVVDVVGAERARRMRP